MEEGIRGVYDGQETEDREIFREDAPLAQEVVRRSRASMQAAQKLHMSISGGMPGTRLRRESVEANLSRLREAMEDLEFQLRMETLNEEDTQELTSL